jgi:plastocyanin
MRVIIAALVAGCALLVAPPASGATTHSVTIAGYAFQPAALTIHAGDTVTWTNQDVAPHDVTTTAGPVAIHGATMEKGQSWSYQFTVPGSYAYICSIHPDMTATLTVLPAVAATTAAAAPISRTHTAARPAAPVHATTGRATIRHPARHTHAAHTPASTPSAAPTSDAAAPAAGTVQAASATPARPLRPLLIVAGIVAAVATLALLLLASRSEDAR